MNATQSPEQWLPIPGYEGSYEVSDQGRVRSVDRYVYNYAGSINPTFLRGRMRRLRERAGGYLEVRLSVDAVPVKHWVHRLVLEAFVGPRPDGTECCHIDGNASNNHVSNLYWGTKSQNAQDRVRHGNHPQARKTECINGHAFDAENTIVRKTGGRDCRTCSRDRSRELMRAKRAREKALQKIGRP